MQSDDPSQTARRSLLWKRRDRSRRSKKDSGVCAGCLPLSRTPGVRRGCTGAWGPPGCSPWTRAGRFTGSPPWGCRLEGPRPPSAHPTCPRVQGLQTGGGCTAVSSNRREGDMSQPNKAPASSTHSGACAAWAGRSAGGLPVLRRHHSPLAILALRHSSG